MFKKVAIIGVGLIGGSLGYAIKQKHLASEVYGCGRMQKNLIIAWRRRLIDHATKDLAKAINGADLILLCAPVRTIDQQLPLIAKKAKKGCLVMDVGSTKEQLVKRADKLFPPEVDFVGAHPIAGTEKSGAKAAVEDLFKNKKCLLTPGKKTSRKALNKAKKFWKKLGSEVFVFDPKTHDKILAATSHLPHMAAFGLVEVLHGLLPFSEIKKMAGGGLLDTTRIAASPADMWADICLTNSKAIGGALKKYIRELQKLEKWIQKKNRSQLFSFFEKAASVRRKL